MTKNDNGFSKWKTGTKIDCILDFGDLEEGTFKMYQDGRDIPCAECNGLRGIQFTAVCVLSPRGGDSVSIKPFN